jgi:hypothetical protein
MFKRSALILLVALFVSLAYTLPAEDVPETTYDESECLPCESTPVLSIPVTEAVAQAAGPRARTCPLLLGSLRLGQEQANRMAGRAYPISDSLTILH